MDGSADGATVDGTVVHEGGGSDADADATARTDSEAGVDAGPRSDGAADARVDAPSDGGLLDADAGGPVATFLVHFDPGQGQLPEGLWRLPDGGAPLVGLTQQALLVTVTPDGGSQLFGAVTEAGAPANSNTLGITTDAMGNVYVAVGSFTPDAGPIPAPGIYRFGPTGGTGVLFSSLPGMNFANGLDFVGTQLLVADSEGAIYTIDTNGVATVWSTDSLLAPDVTACDGGLPAPVGANGIVHDATNVYVTNTNHGWIVKIPITADGGPGTPSKLVEDCRALVGADGLVLDTRDNSLLVAVNVQNKIVRVTGSQTTVVASGAPLDFPASVIIDTNAAGRRLLFTNYALFSGDAGKPGVLALPIP